MILVPVLAAVAMSSAGCLGRLVGEGAEKTLGPKGAYWEEKPVAADKENKALAAYKNFKLGEVTNGFGRNLPADFTLQLHKKPPIARGFCGRCKGIPGSSQSCGG